ncbi:CBN-TAG-141 protein [Caenorhabditis brenneri]|uniref:CBN-TAG-141 protein n=1 Tax=Caenorhabditis brenneri TaxID=135651 RepID=G0MRH7_CAEBE|nr:CBN-TAG-141 protein [Caenorhabditis brenneri]
MDENRLPSSSVILFGTISVTVVSLLSLDHHAHSHEHDQEHHEAHENNHDEIAWYTITPSRQILLRLSVIIFAVNLLYFLEFFLFYRKTHLHYCSPSTKSSVSTRSKVTSGSPVTKLCHSETSGIENNNDGAEFGEGKNSLSAQREQGGHELISLREDEDDAGEICGLKPRALIILFGDGLHNLVDGIAIGASFMVSLKLGLITTLAVICHELPHEIGDLAVLIDSGLTMMKALVLNLLSALTAYIGFFIAIIIGKNEETEKILLAITAGMFLYVAWLSHLKHDALMADHWIVSSVIQLSGFVVGFLLIFGLGWFEHFFDN